MGTEGYLGHMLRACVCVSLRGRERRTQCTDADRRRLREHAGTVQRKNKQTFT